MGIKVSIIVPAYNVEEYIKSLIDCIKRQTMKDFEVIIINDGSTDGTQLILENECKNDDRFKLFCQDNKGVSCTRNFGLNVAQGNYVVFWDADDKVYPDSLENLYNSIQDEDADLAIGKFLINRTTTVSTPKTVQALTSQRSIDKYDHRIVWSLTLTNKIFKREIIEVNSLRFKQFDLGEDVIFVLNYIGYCKKIAGCNELVYLYNKRFSFGNNASLTQQSNKYKGNFLETYIAELEKAAENLFRNINSKEQFFYKERFYQELYRRLIRNNVLYDMYRLYWVLTKEEYNVMYTSFESLKEKLFEINWCFEKQANKDLELSDHLLTEEDMLRNAKFTFVITRQLQSKKALNVIYCLYNQRFPFFEVLIDCKLINETATDRQFKNILDRKNCSIIDGTDLADVKNNAVSIAKGNFIMFFDEPMYVGELTIRKIYESIKTTDNVISIYVKQIKNRKIRDINILNFAFKNKIYEISKNIDVLFSNKIFRVKYLKENSVLFTNSTVNDISKLYSKGNVSMNKSQLMVTDVEYNTFKKNINFKTRIKYKLWRVLFK